MNQFSKKYEAKPEEQLYTKKKDSKKLLKNYFFNGGDDKDDIIIRQIIQHAQKVPFTEADAKAIETLYGNISDAKRTKYFPNHEFGSIFSKNETTQKVEEHIPKTSLPTHTIEIRKEAYKAYQGYQLYKKNLPKIKKNLKVFRILGIAFNKVRSSEAIETFKLLEACGPLYVSLFYRDEEELATLLDTNLPVEFRRQNKVAYQSGFRRYEYKEQTPEVVEAGKKDPKKYKAPEVARDNRAELFKTIKEALNKEENNVKENTGLELYLAIAVEAGQEDDELKAMLNSAKLPKERKAALQAKYPTAFNPPKVQDGSLVQGGVTKGRRNKPMVEAFVSERGFFRTPGLIGKLISFHIGGVERMNKLDLTKLQSMGAGTLGGMAFTKGKEGEYSMEEYQKWLEKHKAYGAEEDRLRKDRRNKRKVNRLDDGQLMAQVDLRDQKKGKDNQQNTITAFAKALPFEGLNYLSGDMGVRSDAGVFKHLFLNVSWKATKNARVKGSEDQNQLADLKIHLQEVTFNNLRAVMNGETYGFGKLSLTDIEIDGKQLLEKAGQKYSAPMELMGMLMNTTFLTIAFAQHIIGRFQGKAAMKDTRKEILTNMAAGPMGLMDITLKVGSVLIENFYGTSMGRIGKIGLGATTMNLKSKQKANEVEDDPNGNPTQKDLRKKREKRDEAIEDYQSELEPDPKLAREIRRLENELATLQNDTDVYSSDDHNKLIEATQYKNDLILLIEKKKNLHAKMVAQHIEKHGYPEDIQNKEKEIKALEEKLEKHHADLQYGLTLSTKEPVVMKDAQLLQDMMREMLLSGMKDSGLTLEGLEGLTDIELPKGLTLGALASANAVKDMTLDVPKVKIPNILKAKRFQYDMQLTNKAGKVRKDNKGNDLISLRAIGTNVSIENIALEVNVAFNDLEVNANEKKDEGMIKNLVINNLSAKSFKFDKLWLKMPESTPMPKEDKDNNDKTKETLSPPQKLHDILVVNTPSELTDIKVGFNMNEKSFSLNFEKLMAQKDKKNIQIDSEFASKDESSALDEKSQLLLQKVEGLKFGMDKDGKMTAIVGNVTVPQIVLQQFGFKNETIAISHNQDENRNTKTSIKEVTLQNLEFVMDKQGYHIKQLAKLSIAEVLLSGKVTYKGDTIPLNNGSIQGIEATNLKIDIEKGKSILEMVQQGSASIEKINLPKIVYGTVGHLDLFDIGKIKVDRITEKGKEGIDYSVGSIKVRGGSKVKGKDISGGLSTSVGGKYTENKDKEGSISTTLTNTKVDAEVKNKQGKKEMAAKLSAQTISLDTDMTNYATLSLGAALNLDHIFYEAADGTYVKNVPGGAPLQLINPRAKVTFVKEKVKNKEGVEELKTVAYKVEYFNIGKIVGRNLEAGNLTTGKKLLEANDQQLSLENLHVSGIYHTSGKAFTVNASTGQFKLTELKSDLVSKFKLNASLKSTSISFTQKENGGKHLKVKLNQMEVGTANEDKTIEGKLKTDNITFESDLSNYATLSLGKALELSKLHYEDKKGSYIKTLEPNKSPVKLVKPVARLKMIKNKQNKVEAYKLEYLNIEKITAGNLEIHQESTPEKKPGDLLAPKTTKTTLKLSGEEEVTLSKIHLEGKIETGNNDFEIKAEADSFDLKKLQVMVENQLRTYTYLSTGKLSYERAMHGDHTAEVNNLDVGLHKQGGKGHEILALGGLGGLKINKQSKDDQISIFKATKIRYGTFGDESFVVLTDPQIGPLVIEGRFMQGTGDYFKDLQFNKLIVKGGVKGDLILRDTPDKLTLESFQDVVIAIPEADLEASSLSNLLAFGKNKEKDEALKKKRKEKIIEEWHKVPELKPAVQDGVRQPIITPKLTAEELYKHSLAGRAEAYQFLNMFGGSHLTIKLLDKKIGLHVNRNKQEIPTIKIMTFLREFIDATFEYFVKIFVPSVLQGTVNDIKPEILNQGINSLRNTFENDFKGAFNSDGSMTLPNFMVMTEELAANPAKYINGIIDAAWSAYIRRVREEARKRRNEDPNALEDLISDLLSEGFEEIAKAIVNYNMSDDDTKDDDLSRRLVPKVVDEILENLKLELILDAKIKQRKNSHYKEYGKSSLEPGGFKGHSSISIKFDRKQEANEQGYRIDTQISVSNTNFSGFSFPVKSDKGNGKISTREMNISELSVKKQSFEDDGKISLKAKNIYLKGLQLEFNKKKDTPKNKKGN